MKKTFDSKDYTLVNEQGKEELMHIASDGDHWADPDYEVLSKDHDFDLWE